MQDLTDIVGNTDIYLIDQITKARYHSDQKILDAGCGSGRNLLWFLNNKFTVYAVDRNTDAIVSLRRKYPELLDRSAVVSLENMPFADSFFDHIISSAVLHFADNTDHFFQLLTEHVRVLKPNGTILIRMTSDIGLEKTKLKPIGEGVYQIPDGSTRFLLSRDLYADMKVRFNFTELEPIKTTIVNDLRSMTTLVLQHKPAHKA